MRSIEVCLTPTLVDQYDFSGKIAVVADIFRATSCMVTGLAHGLRAIYPVATVDECFELGKAGKVMAGERGGEKVEGFDMGNSPFEYMEPSLKDKEIGVSTTNGTKAILASTSADEVVIGAFINLSAVRQYVIDSQIDVIVHCAGWKGAVNIEDTLFAGALIAELDEAYTPLGDAALMARDLYYRHATDLMTVAHQSSHAQRLAGFGVIKDLEYCMEKSLFSVVPTYQDGKISLN